MQSSGECVSQSPPIVCWKISTSSRFYISFQLFQCLCWLQSYHIFEQCLHFLEHPVLMECLDVHTSTQLHGNRHTLPHIADQFRPALCRPLENGFERGNLYDWRDVVMSVRLHCSSNGGSTAAVVVTNSLSDGLYFEDGNWIFGRPISGSDSHCFSVSAALGR